ncbi:unnamed protein product [Ectocarpus fasciculatus]
MALMSIRREVGVWSSLRGAPRPQQHDRRAPPAGRSPWKDFSVGTAKRRSRSTSCGGPADGQALLTSRVWGPKLPASLAELGTVRRGMWTQRTWVAVVHGRKPPLDMYVCLR